MAQEERVANQPSLGQQLAAARELRNISVDAVATELRLTNQRILEIEQDDYSHTAGKAYARGYVYNYARYLGFPLDETMVQFEKTYKIVLPPPRQLETKFLFNNKPITTGHPYVRWITLLIILLLAGLVIVWASNRYDKVLENQNKGISEVGLGAPNAEDVASLFPNRTPTPDAREVILNPATTSHYPLPESHQE